MGIMNSPINMGGDWETVGGGQWHAGQRVDPGGWTYSKNYSGNIPNGSRTFDPNARQRIRGQWYDVQPPGIQQASGTVPGMGYQQQGGPLGQYGGGGGGQQLGFGGGGGSYDPNMGGINLAGPQQGMSQANGSYMNGVGGGQTDPMQGGGLNMQQIMQQMYGQGGWNQGYGGWGGLQTNKGWR